MSSEKKDQSESQKSISETNSLSSAAANPVQKAQARQKLKLDEALEAPDYVALQCENALKERLIKASKKCAKTKE